MNLTCPCCHATTSLEQLTQDEAARELLALRGQIPAATWPHLIAYLGLFRSATRALAWARALRLAREVIEIPADPVALAAALFETVEAIRAKREAGDVRPLKNHNYLRRVLESVEVTGAVVPSLSNAPVTVPAVRRATKIDQAELLLAAWAGDDALLQVIGHGLTALLARPLAKAPEAAAIDRTASLWARDLAKHGLTAADAARVEIAFDRLLSRCKEWFPVAADLLEHLPRNTRRQELPEPPLNEEQIAKAKEFFGNIVGDKGLPVAAAVDLEQRRVQLQEQARKLKQEGG